MLPNVSHEMGNKPDRSIDYPEPLKFDIRIREYPAIICIC